MSHQQILIFVILLCDLFASSAIFPSNVCADQPVDDGYTIDSRDWPWWRGPKRDGHAASDQSSPTQWSATENIAWKTPIAGRGYGSPILFGNHIVLPTSDESTGSQSVVCLDRKTGKQFWSTVVHASGGMRKNNKSTAASSTAAWDGERILVNFPNANRIVATALSLTGQQLWQQDISQYVEHQGFGSSPTVYRSLVYINSDNKSGGTITALDRRSGQVVWKRDRPTKPNYPSPIVLKAAGRDQLVVVGCDQTTSYDPLSGETLWEVPGATTECVTSTVTDGYRVYTSGGYPKNHMSAVSADGSGKVEWENGERVYVPSLLIKDGYLYGVLDAGVAACWNCQTGKEMWKGRLNGTFSASPVMVGDTIYVTSESGETFLYRASPTKFELLGSNQLGEEVFATPVFVENKIYYRANIPEDGRRQEYLICIASAE